ncbi:uncharacterized protein LOC142329529 [Lycorma delicatula]|uniref:uncharacterized protein LOC142329529 n=1 Tax=Lycorma delicatula TaxID=130591 RepID=UPI003F513734
MYSQVLVDPRDYDLQRIIWRNSSEEEIGHYQLKTITYGTASVLFLATRCIIQLANENSKQFPKASEVIRRDFYVDDLQTGADDLTEAMQLQGEITAILKQAGFDLRKWCPNSSALLESVTETDDSNHRFNISSKGINTLGLIWNHIEDTLCFSTNVKIDNSFTKRSVLATISSIFYPLGLLGPIIMQCKLFMQQLWLQNLEWDDKLPENLLNKWSDICKKIPFIEQIKIPRLVSVLEKY